MRKLYQLTPRLITVLVLNSLACTPVSESAFDPQPEPAYFAGYTCVLKPTAPSQISVCVSLCTEQEPTDIEVNLYNFGPDTNADDDLAMVLHPGSASIPVDQVVSIRTMYTDSIGNRLSDYDSEKRFSIPVNRNGVSVLTLKEADGTIRANWVITTNKTVSDVCLNIVSARGGRLTPIETLIPQPRGQL